MLLISIFNSIKFEIIEGGFTVLQFPSGLVPIIELQNPRTFPFYIFMDLLFRLFIFMTHRVIFDICLQCVLIKSASKYYPFFGMFGLMDDNCAYL